MKNKISENNYIAIQATVFLIGLLTMPLYLMGLIYLIFPLMVFQILSSIYYLANWKQLSKISKRIIGTYWLTLTPILIVIAYAFSLISWGITFSFITSFIINPILFIIFSIVYNNEKIKAETGKFLPHTSF